MSSRTLQDLSDPMLWLCSEFEAQLRGAGIEYVRACTYRSYEEQDYLFTLGRTRPGRVVTHARGGESRHNDEEQMRPASNAADYYPLVAGKLCGDKTDAELELWAQMGKIGVACGLIWGGNWPAKKRDRPHFERPIEPVK